MAAADRLKANGVANNDVTATGNSYIEIYIYISYLLACKCEYAST